MTNKKKEESLAVIPMDDVKQGLELFHQKKDQLKTLVEQSSQYTLEEVQKDPARFEAMSATRKSIKAERILITKEGKRLRDLVRPLLDGISTNEKDLVAMITDEEARLQGIEDKINEAKEVERRKKQKERDERIQNRTNILLHQIGMIFSGTDYTIEHEGEKVVISQLDIINMDEEKFLVPLNQAQKIAHAIKADKEEDERLERVAVERTGELSKLDFKEEDYELKIDEIVALPEEEYIVFYSTVKKEFDKNQKQKEEEKKHKQKRTSDREKVLTDLGYKKEGSMFRLEGLQPVMQNVVEEYLDYDFDQLVTSLKKSIDDAAELKKLQDEKKLQQEEQTRLHNEKVKNRQEQLVNAGLNYNGSAYVFRTVHIDGGQIAGLEPEAWGSLLTEAKNAIQKIKDQEAKDAEEQKLRDAMAKARTMILNQRGYILGEEHDYVHNKFSTLTVNHKATMQMEDKEFITFVTHLDAEIQKEEQKLIDAENALKSDKEQLKMWVDNFKINTLDGLKFSEQSIKLREDIYSRFNGFKNWATEEINKLK